MKDQPYGDGRRNPYAENPYNPEKYLGVDKDLFLAEQKKHRLFALGQKHGRNRIEHPEQYEVGRLIFSTYYTRTQS